MPKIEPKHTESAKEEPITGQSFVDIPSYQETPGEEYMNPNQLHHIEKILLAHKNMLMQEVDKTIIHMKEEANNYPDPFDRASQEEEFNVELRTRDRERQLMIKINETLGRVREKDFGYCEACGLEIGLKRLEARPTATLCIDCKTLAEIKERQNHGG